MTSYYNQDCEKYVSSVYRRFTTETDCDEDEEQAECKMMCSIDKDQDTNTKGCELHE